MAGVLKDGSQPDEVARVFEQMKSFGRRRPPAEAGQRTIVGTSGEKAVVALGREVRWF